MSNEIHIVPPDQDQRKRALDPRRSILVQAPAGSGKTDLLTRRFLRLLSQVEDPTQIVAITFTKAAAAEMRHRILSELENSAANEVHPGADDFSMKALAHRAYERSHTSGWNLTELPTQLRILTIDAFCRELALKQPLLSDLGGALDIAQQPDQLYRLAAKRTIQMLGNPPSFPDVRLHQSIESLLEWRDNNWEDLERQLVSMLKERDRWMQGFVLESEQDWDLLRERLERPFARAVSAGIVELEELLKQCPAACKEAMELSRFACENSEEGLHSDLAELADFPCGPFTDHEHLDAALKAHLCLAKLVLTNDGLFRQRVDKRHGFPAHLPSEKQRLTQLTRDFACVSGLQAALSKVKDLPPLRYQEHEWNIVRACFALLRHAVAELKVSFAEVGSVDYIEVAQLALRVLESSDGMPSDAAIDIADGIHHLLVDEFQDTSRKQHKLIASLVTAWPDATARTVFVVGDPMQSIYFFRDADAELFQRVRHAGLALLAGESHDLEFAPLASNFRTRPELVNSLNNFFADIFTSNTGSDIGLFPSQSMRPTDPLVQCPFHLHMRFVPQPVFCAADDPAATIERDNAINEREQALKLQTGEMVGLIRKHLVRIEPARLRGEKYRIAVLGRSRAVLAPIAQGLRAAEIPFRALDLEPLANRPEVLDVLALAQALFNGEARVAWLSVLRAPWCGLSLDDLHMLVSADDPALIRTPVPELIRARGHLLSAGGRRGLTRVTEAFGWDKSHQHNLPSTSLGTRIKRVWEQLGGPACVSSTATSNLELLWKCFDALPGGGPDLLGSALPAAMEKLTAQPDPEADESYGVQLMTIHKSKGLEFEVVIVPELQAGTNQTKGQMLTWLERGLAAPDDSGDATEFLIAPMQSKGTDRSKTKEWVDHVYRDRERQEMRRILYVAATRAREELHFFARLTYKEEPGRELVLCEPAESLLSAAWPALQNTAQSQFDEWTRQFEQTGLVTLAAAGEPQLLDFSSGSGSNSRPAIIRRLPADYRSPNQLEPVVRLLKGDADRGFSSLYQRHEGGIASRAIGYAVHAFFEEFAGLRATQSEEAIRTVSTSRIARHIRTFGIASDEAQKLAHQALGLALRAMNDPIAGWILSPHPGGGSETRWTGAIDGSIHTVQIDRVFRAGSLPHSQGDDVWWIIDYKTAHADYADSEWNVREWRTLFAPQVEIYARMLRNLYGPNIPIRVGLYYPRMLQFDWWEV